MSSQHRASDPTYISLDQTPDLLGLYGRAALASLPVVGGKRDSTKPPKSGFVLDGYKVDTERLAKYTSLSRLRLTSHLPLTYPFVLSFPLVMKVLTSADFPFAAIGAVHLTNVIEQFQPLAVDDELNVRVHAENLREHPKGLLIDLVTEIRTNGSDVVAWRQASSFLSKRRTSLTPAKGSARSTRPPVPTAAELGPAASTFTVTPAQIARYASVSGDRNPIHVSRVGAKAFGFPGLIAHGMWTAAAMLSCLEGSIQDQVRYTVEFGKPVVLPANLSLFTRSNDNNRGGHIIEARKSSKLETLHATGTVDPI